PRGAWLQGAGDRADGPGAFAQERVHLRRAPPARQCAGAGGIRTAGRAIRRGALAPHAFLTSRSASAKGISATAWAPTATADSSTSDWSYKTPSRALPRNHAIP